MRLDHGFLGWGVFFVVVGSTALAIANGLIPDRQWWSYWPLILVGAGVGLVLRRTPFEVVGGLIVAATFGVMVGGSVAGGFMDVGGLTSGVCRAGEGATAFADRTGTLGGQASVDIELDCGTLVIATVAGNGWAVRGTDQDGRGPRSRRATRSWTSMPVMASRSRRPGSSTCRPARSSTSTSGSTPGRCGPRSLAPESAWSTWRSTRDRRTST